MANAGHLDLIALVTVFALVTPGSPLSSTEATHVKIVAKSLDFSPAAQVTSLWMMNLMIMVSYKELHFSIHDTGDMYQNAEFSQQRPPHCVVFEFANLRLLTHVDRGVRVALGCRGALAQCRREKD